MAKFIKKRFPVLFVATYFIVALSMVGFLVYPMLFTEASVAADFTNNGAATATVGPSYTDRLVLDVTIPDAWSGGAYTADTLYYDAGVVDNWQGDTLNSFPALGTPTGVGYVEDLVDPGFQTTEAVVRDLDADSVVTSAADDLIDGDGSGSTGAGTVDPAAAGGDALLAMGNDIGHGAKAICTDSTPYGYTAVRIDLDGDCTNNGSNDGTYVLGTNATAAGTEVTLQWAFGDAVTMGGNADGDYDDGEDIFVENNIGELTYSAEAEPTFINSALVGSTISDFPADCDGGGAGTQACKYTGTAPYSLGDNIYIDGGTAGGAAPNSVVDRQDDLLTGLGVQNTGTAVDITDIGIVEVWADAGAAGFQGFGVDTTLGTMTVNSGDTKEWRLGGLAQPVAATVGQRIFVSVDVAAAPTNARTLIFQIPVYNDVSADGIVSSDGDVGVFMESTNDGPTNVVILNANTQTIDSQAPTVTSRATADADGDGQIDRIIFTTDENLDDIYTAITIDVTGYAGETYSTGGVANDNIFWVNFTESGSSDTGAIPDTQITFNTKLSDAYENNIATDGAPVASTDSALPILVSATYRDLDSNGAVDTLRTTWSENVIMSSSTAVDWTVAAGSSINAAFSAAADDLVGGTTLDVTVTADAGETSSAVAPTIAYDNDDANNSVTDTALVPNVAGTNAAVTATDGAAPVIMNTYSVDADVDGDVETIDIAFSENISDATVDPTYFTFDDDTVYDFSINEQTGFGGSTTVVYPVADADANDQYYRLTVIAGGIPGTAAAYLHMTAAGLSDGTNLAATGNALGTENDRALPHLNSATYRNIGGGSAVNTLRTTWSENVTMSGSTAVDWTIAAGSSINAVFSAAADDAVAGTTLDVTVTADIDETSSTIAPTIAYDNDDANDSIIDGTGNAAATNVAVTSTDAATPVLLSGSYLDLDSNNAADTLRTTWSENVMMAGSTAVDWTITGGTINAAFSSAANDLIGGPTLDITITADSNKTGGAVNPTIAYDNDDANDSIADTSPAFNLAGTTGAVSMADGMAPIILNTYSVDSDSDGDVNALDIQFSENISDATVTAASFEFDNDNINNATGEETASGGSTTVVFPAADSGVNDEYYRLTVTTGITGTDLAYLHMTAAGLSDGANLMATGSALGTENDRADPIVMSTSPADGASGVALDASFSMTFSEAMTTGDFTSANVGRSPAFDLGTAVWSVGDTVVTSTNHDPWAGLQIYTIDLVQGSINSAAAGDSTLDNTAIVADPYTFTTVASGGGGGGGGGGLPASVTVYSPNGGESWAGLSSHNITWSSTSTTISKVKLYYSLDRGVNFPYTIATDETNDGSYSWTVPNVPSGTVKVKVEGYDSSGVFVASDISDADFTITYVTPPVTPPGTPETPGVPTPENPAGLVAGDLFKSPLSTTVYYFGSDNKRHIFPNEKTYKSWYLDWSNIKTITALELQQMTLGKNVTVRPGTVLVKIQTDPKVYAVEPNGLLRWIPTEAKIRTLYGENWATKIIDVPLAFWGDYSFGSDISTDTHPTGALVNYVGTTDVYYIQGAEKRKITTVGFTANNFRSEYILSIPTTLYYITGAEIIGAESLLTSIY